MELNMTQSKSIYVHTRMKETERGIGKMNSHALMSL